MWSPTGQHWWDGTAWRQVSPDGTHLLTEGGWAALPGEAIAGRPSATPAAAPEFSAPATPAPAPTYGTAWTRPAAAASAPTPVPAGPQAVVPAAPVAPPPVAAAPVAVPPPVPARRSSGRIVALVAGALVALLVVIGVVAVATGSKDSRKASAVVTATPTPTARPTPRATPTPTALPTRVPTPPPTAVSTPAAAGLSGFGDTAKNPDTSYICAFEAFADDNTTIIAYATVAGPNKSDGQTVCDTLRGVSVYREVDTLKTPKAAACYRSTADGGVTARVYQASTGSPATTSQLCDSLMA